MNSTYLLLFPAIYLAMFVYLSILVAVTRIRAAKKRNYQPSIAKHKASPGTEPRFNPKQLGVEEH
jgi:hypothetical protein